ncbi:DET1 homolog isoform X2 [Scaptodrosophila lebanonensis]|uniref:DET1 homolog isoform X2 n=1 Tax=Drosophila lebanonensis TaxID=7225 RepID=A0A6J2UFW5_DROLE|nr:DET1 homolog isoform X2 [Scaptodrosophila lebanonensis]
MLQNRESVFKHKKKSTPWHFYRSITPNLTVQYVDIPSIYLRKFTPDGSKLIGFSHDQHSLLVYNYKGIAAAGEVLSESGVGNKEWISNDMLHNFARYHLHREFSVFLENGRYVLIAAMLPYAAHALPPSDYLRYPDIYDRVVPYTYLFSVVDLKLGIISDQVILPHDAITMSHNHGVSVYGNTIAILSRLYQCVHIFELVNGVLVRQEQIGPRPRGHMSNIDEDIGPINVNSKLAITHIKQRVLSFLYKQFECDDMMTREQKCVNYQKFYKNFSFIEFMVMEKMQLIDNEFMLLRYEERPGVNDIMESMTPRRLFVFYSISSENVVGVYQEESAKFLNIVLKYNDTFCNVRSFQTGAGPLSSTNQIVRKTIQSLAKSPALLHEAVIRFNQSVPISSQSFTTTPYLNCNLFCYDEKAVSPMERPKICSTSPIQFLDKASGLIAFRLNSQARMPVDLSAPRELCAFIFHPYEPLVISIQKCMHRYTFNVHIYNQSTIVKQY